MILETLFLLIISIDFVQTFSFTTVVTFGDGNTDTGNVYNLTNHQWPLVPPYYQGRFSNGPIWIDDLTIPNKFNYAYDDATIDNYNLMIGFSGPNQTLVPGIRQQIIMYLTANNIVTTDLSKTLYVIWPSGIEYMHNSNLSADQIVASLVDAIDDLLIVGIQDLLIVNLPPLQSYPGMNNNRRLRSLVTKHNNYLLSNITSIQSQYPNVWIEVFDLNILITKILSNNSMLKLNPIDSCWNILNFTILSQCFNPDQYVFIDNYHFTRVIHQIIVDNIHQILCRTSRGSFISPTCSIFICLIIYKFSINR